MKIRSTILLFFTFCFFTSMSIAQTEFNQLDSEGKHHGAWKKTYPRSKQVRYEGTFEHGKEVGEFKFYCKECKDVPSTIKVFNRENTIADVKYFTLKGKLVSEGKMDGKDRIGEWLYYHKDSKQLMSKENYVDGKLDGTITTYYPNGKITEEKNYKFEVLEGENNYYSPNGILLKKLKYVNGKLHGPAFYYDADGILAIEGTYKNDKKDGLWKYFKGGKVVLEETYPLEEFKSPQGN